MGKIRLDRAVALYQKVYPGGRHDTFRIVWHAFYLEPSAPVGVPGVPWAERHAQKLIQRGGGDSDPAELEAKGRHLREQLAAKGRQHGIAFSFEGKFGSTRDAHRLIALAGRKEEESSKESKGGDEKAGLQDRVVMQLFRDFFEGDADITSRAMLAGLAEETGLGQREAILAWLESGEGGHEVDEEARWAREEGQMKGVPRFVLQGTHVIDGAEDEQAFLEAIVKAKEGGETQGAEQDPTSSGKGDGPGTASTCTGSSCS